jgi:hypothetical protein
MMTFWFPPNGGVNTGAAVIVAAAAGVVLSVDCVGCGFAAAALSAFGFRLTSRTSKMTPTTIAPAMIRIRVLNGSGPGAAATSRTALGELSALSRSFGFASTTVATLAAAPQPGHTGVFAGS